MKIFRIIRLTLLAIVSIVLLWSTWNYFGLGVSVSKHKYIPLTLPIEFAEGKVFQGQFDVDLDESYEIAVLFHRNISQNDLDSLVGYHSPVVGSNNRNNTLPIFLSLWQDDTLILKSDTIDMQSYSYTADYLGRLIGFFNGEERRHYRIKVTIKQTIPLLNKTTPELRVSVMPYVYKRELLNKEITRLVNRKILFYSCIIFVVMLLMNIFFELRSRLTRRSCQKVKHGGFSTS